jgi:CheY-specific phosphatase CheX
MQDPRTLIERVVEQALMSLLEHLAVPATLEDCGAVSGHDVACAMGFASPTLRGSVTLTSHREMLRACRPVELRSTAATAVELADWLGELTNQLLGRCKNRLIGQGIVIELGIPAVLVGVDIRYQPRAMPLGCRKLVRSPAGTLFVDVAAHPLPGFEFNAAGAEEAQVLPEGELALF